MAQKYSKPVAFQFGDFQFNTDTRELWRNGRKHLLPVKPAELLMLLLHKAPATVSRDEIVSTLWGDRKYADFDDRLNHIVARLRRSLLESASHPHYVLTAPGVGYRFIAPVTQMRSNDCEASMLPVAGRFVSASRSRRVAALTATVLAAVAVVGTLALRSNLPADAAAIRPRLSVPVTLNLTFDPTVDQLSESFNRRLRGDLIDIGAVDLTVPASAQFSLHTALYAGEHTDSFRLAAVLETGDKRRRIWSEIIERGDLSIERFQIVAADTVATEALRKLLPDEESRLAASQPTTSEIEQLHRAGRDALRAGSLNDAIEFFNSIIEIDSDRALAHSDLARALIHKGWYTAVPSANVVPNARIAAEAALSLDPSLAEPYLALANTAAFYDWDWEHAGELYRQAIVRNPGHAASYLDYAAYLFVTGRLDEGIAQLHIAERVDPISASTHGQIGILYHYIHEWEAAHRHYDAALALEPRNLNWRMHKGCTYIFQGELDRGVEMIRQLRADFPRSPMPMVIEAYYHAAIGEHAKAGRLLDALDAAELPPVTELMRASIYVALERESEAVEILQSARDKRLLALPLTAIHPTHDPLRSRADYQSLLVDLGLEEQGVKRLSRR